MSEEIKSKVFGGYISVNKEKWRHGIGLFVSRQIIEAHEGKVWIESELGKGTTVSFSLPYGEKTDE
jgi:signal transduction histidine kinase